MSWEEGSLDKALTGQELRTESNTQNPSKLRQMWRPHIKLFLRKQR